MRYWITVVSKDHTERGVAGGFMQACHGKQQPLKRMSLNDWVIFYSPRQSMLRDEKCQSFTAIGQVIDENIYQFVMAEDFLPFRRNIRFYPCKEVAVAPLIDELEFIANKQRWGAPFRYGFLEIPESDFNLISKYMLNDGR
jgi:predicted RNA-binding protein